MRKLVRTMVSGTVAAAMVMSCSGIAFAGDSTEGADYSGIKIGMLLSGSAKDGGWSEMAADAAKAVEEKYGCTVSFSESVQATDYESVMRGFADAGYDIIVPHGGEFLDTTLQVAGDYPDITFVNTSALKESMTDAPENVTGIDFGAYGLGYLVGIACGYATESGKIGAIGSNEISSLVQWSEAVKDGAKSVNPDAEVTVVWTGSYDDQVKAKQCVDTLHDQGCDVITQNADACGIGAVQECDALGIKNIGNVADETKEGDSCFLSFIQDAGFGIETAIDEAVTGTLPSGYYDMGAVETDDGAVISMSDYSGTYKDTFTDEQKKYLEDKLEKFHNGDDITAD